MNARSRRLDWDSDFFGFPIGESRPATVDELAAADEWAAREQLRCHYLLLTADPFPLLQAAEARGFYLTGVRTTCAAEAPFKADLTGTGGTRVRAAQTSDVGALEHIAATAHPDTRFFADPRFSREDCARLYASWIRRSTEGWADCVLVAEPAGGAPPIGYVTLHHDGECARIGLIAVAGDTRRSGVGRALMVDAFRWCDARGVRRLTVATQAQNASALGFYLRCGFEIEGVDFWLHKWRP